MSVAALHRRPAGRAPGSARGRLPGVGGVASPGTTSGADGDADAAAAPAAAVGRGGRAAFEALAAATAARGSLRSCGLPAGGSANTVAKLMAEHGSGGPAAAASPATTRPDGSAAGSGPGRAPDFTAGAAQSQVVRGLTEIPTDEGKLYLAAWWTWAPGGSSGSRWTTITTPNWPGPRWGGRRGPRRPRSVAGVILHTDQGSEYTARPFRAACRRCGITQSMGRTGSALDNAVIESWHSTLEFELRRLEQFATKAQARPGSPPGSTTTTATADIPRWVCAPRSTTNAPREHARSVGKRDPIPAEHHGAVLAGVKAKPFGWPPASLDPGSGRSRTTTDEAGREKNGQDPLNSSLYGSRGLPYHRRAARGGSSTSGGGPSGAAHAPSTRRQADVDTRPPPRR